jgi:arabinofuranosyltransferase
MKIESSGNNCCSRIIKFLGHSNYGKWLIRLLLLMLFIVIIRRAWVSDDAFITFRTVDNFVNGYGLTWNTFERVQAYTHPLWMFLISLFYFFTHEIFFTVIIVSLIISLLSVSIIPMKLSKSEFGSLLAISVLLFSNAFVDYCTSGLENPLSYLLSAVFLLVYFNDKSGEYSSKELFFLSLISSLAALNRLDSFVIFLPALLFAFWKSDNKIEALKYLALGQFPIILWEIFSVIYYGFPFPNTYYAKLNHMMPKDQVLIQGGNYWIQSLLFDPVTLFTIISFSTLFFTSNKNRKNIQTIAVIVGVMLYIAGITTSGGDFMAGRFFALPVFIFSILISRVEINPTVAVFKYVFLFLVVILGLISTPETYNVSFVTESFVFGIANERAYYFPYNGLIHQENGNMHPDHAWAKEGRYYEKGALTEEKVVVIRKSIGMFGYFAGPNVHIIDRLGLCDPLLARLPAINDENWRIGHFIRFIPEGYEMTVRTGKNLIEDEYLRVYYDNLSLITQGRIFTLDRFKAIIDMNLGHYDSLINIEKYQYAY